MVDSFSLTFPVILTEFIKPKKNQLFTHCLYAKSDFTSVFASENGSYHSLHLQNSWKSDFNIPSIIKCKIKID